MVRSNPEADGGNIDEFLRQELGNEIKLVSDIHAEITYLVPTD